MDKTNTLMAFLKDETGLCHSNQLPPHLAKFGLAFLVFNEIRGLIVVYLAIEVMW